MRSGGIGAPAGRGHGGPSTPPRVLHAPNVGPMPDFAYHVWIAFLKSGVLSEVFRLDPAHAVRYRPPERAAPRFTAPRGGAGPAPATTDIDERGRSLRPDLPPLPSSSHNATTRKPTLPIPPERSGDLPQGAPTIRGGGFPGPCRAPPKQETDRARPFSQKTSEKPRS